MTVLQPDPLACTGLFGWQFDNRGADWLDRYKNLLVPEASKGFPGIQQLDQQLFVLHFAGMAKFEVSYDTRTVTAFDVKDSVTDPTLSHLLLDHVAPRVLAHQGGLVLHASAVDFGGKLAIFLGETGAGKSTLAASLHAAGFPLLGDDAVVITRSEGSFLAKAVYSSLRLYPDAIDAILGNGTSATAMAHYSDKQRVDLVALNVNQRAPLPVAAIFFLTRETSPAPTIQAVNPMEACMKLIEQSFALALNSGESAISRMTAASAMASDLPSYKLTYPRDFSLIPTLHEVILECVAAEESGSSAH